VRGAAGDRRPYRDPFFGTIFFNRRHYAPDREKQISIGRCIARSLNDADAKLVDNRQI
jgi:hypothetical protein